MELDAASIRDLRSGGLIMHVNKVHHVTTINRVAKDLGENEDWLFDVANEMDTEDGVIWVYGLGEDGVMAFTDFGIENLDRTHQNPQRRPHAPATLKWPDCIPRGLSRMVTCRPASMTEQQTRNWRR